MTTREEIIKMAREAEIGDSHGHFINHEIGNLEAFYQAAYAAGVAAERNKPWPQDHWTEYEKVIYAQGKLDGMEEAAKVCDDLWQNDATAYDCREAIREKAAEVTK